MVYGQLLSEHFRLNEFLQSQYAARLGRTIVPSPSVVQNLTTLAQEVLEPLRQYLGRAISINSGYRPDWLNAAIGGAPNSAHLEGRAADIEVVGMSPLVVARWLDLNKEQVPFDKVILEFPESSSGGWTHVQIAKPGAKPRGQFFIAERKNDAVVYSLQA